MRRADEEPSGRLERLLQRSEDMHTELARLLQGSSFGGSTRRVATVALCSVGFEHAHSLRVLLAVGNPTSATALIRLQFETVVRGMWALWIASDEDLAKLTAPLEPAGEIAAKGLPNVGTMICLLQRGIGTTVPEAAHEMLARFKDASWHSLNSYIHAGIHVVHWHNAGFPVPLACQVLELSNALSTMGAMLLANLTGSPSLTLSVGQIQPAFADCLPELLPWPTYGGREDGR